MMTVTSNLTRDEAAERARLLRVESYQVELDLTGGELTFGSVATVRFSCQRPGASSFIDLTAPEVSEAILNGRTLPANAFDGHRIALDDLAESNRADGQSPMRLLAQRRGPAPVHRPCRQGCLPLLRPGDFRRAPGSTPASTSPT